MRIMGLLRGDANTEANVQPTAEMMAKMGAFIEEVTRAGVLLATDGLKPSIEGKRVKLEDGKFTVVDGPFAETKELIAGSGVYEVATMSEAVHWTKRFLEVLGKGECEIRPLFDAADFNEDIFPPEAAAREEATRRKMQRNVTR